MFSFFGKKSQFPKKKRTASLQESVKLFEQLEKQEIVNLYNSAKIKKVAAGARIIKEGNSDRVFYILMKGEIKITKLFNRKDITLATLKEGECLGEIAFIKKAKRTASAFAVYPSTLMVFDESTLQSIPAGIRIKINEYLIELMHKREDSLNQKELKLSQKNDFLVSRYEDIFNSTAHNYGESELIVDIIKNIPRLPLYATKLLSQLTDTDVKVSDIVKNINQDPSLVAMILKQTNSAFYNFQSRVDNIQHAVMLIGFNQVHKILVDNGVKSTMPNTKEFHDLQYHSFIISLIAYEIALQCSREKALACSTAAILHDIGKSIIFLLQAKYPKLSVVINLIDYTKVGMILMEEWGLPGKIAITLEYQEYPRFFAIGKIPEEVRQDTVVLYLSHLFLEFLDGKDEETLPDLSFQDFLKVLHIKEASPMEFFKKTLLPNLRKKKKAFPEEFRQSLDKRFLETPDIFR